MTHWSEKVAIITGGGSGIGRSVAKSLAARGARILVADKDPVGGRETVSEIEGLGGVCRFEPFDVSSDSYEALRDVALEAFGQIDIVMNNVGLIGNGLPENIPIEEWRKIIDVNLLSVVRSNLVFVPYFKELNQGHIVITSSFAGLYTYSFDRLPYAATKAALVQIAEGLAIYLRPMGVKVTLLCPGPVMTNIARSIRWIGPRTELRGPGAQFQLMTSDAVGEILTDAIESDKFLVATHEQVRGLLVERARDWDGFIQNQIDHPNIVNIT